MIFVSGVERIDDLVWDIFACDYVLSKEDIKKAGAIMRKGLSCLIDNKTVGECLNECNEII